MTSIPMLPTETFRLLMHNSMPAILYATSREEGATIKDIAEIVGGPTAPYYVSRLLDEGMIKREYVIVKMPDDTGKGRAKQVFHTQEDVVRQRLATIDGIVAYFRNLMEDSQN